MKTAFFKWWYGNDRFNDVVNGLMNHYEDVFFFGGWVRGQVDTKKEISDLDVSVKDGDFVKVENYLMSIGCREVFSEQPPSWLRRRMYGTGFFEPEATFTTVGQYSRFMCPKAVKVDLIDHKAFEETIETMPSDVHFLVSTREGLKSYDEKRFPTEELIQRMRNKSYLPLRPDAVGCEKLDKEGFVSVNVSEKE